MDGDQRALLGERVRDQRTAKFGTKLAAYQTAGLNPATWDRIEAGEPVREDRLRAAVRILWPQSGGDWHAVIAGDLGPREETEELPRWASYAKLAEEALGWARTFADDPEGAMRSLMEALALVNSAWRQLASEQIDNDRVQRQVDLYMSPGLAAPRPGAAPPDVEAILASSDLDEASKRAIRNELIDTRWGDDSTHS